MNIKFKNIHLQNFMSFGDATIALNNGGYTLVSGVNQNPDDLAKSNGSGKSSIWEAISWVLTGETIRGSKSVVNINSDDGAVVEMEFDVDGHAYKLLRSKDHSKYKTTLKIYVDGDDKSGKGIRDTEKLLTEYLPDLTSSLIGSVIILGQGLPQRFSNNSPSGRKEVLEKLSKSDFMIADLKDRITKRKNVIQNKLRGLEDEVLKLNTTQSMVQRNIEQYKHDIDNLPDSSVLIEELNRAKTEFNDWQITIDDYKAKVETDRVSMDEASSKVTELVNKVNETIQSMRDEYTPIADEYKSKFFAVRSEINSKTEEARKLDNVSDICPTCGQKLPGVTKFDTTALHAEIERLKAEYNEITAKSDKAKIDLDTKIAEVRAQYKEQIDILTKTKNDCQILMERDSDFWEKGIRQQKSANDRIIQIQSQIDGREDRLNSLKSNIQSATAELETIGEKIVYNNNEIELMEKHSEVINKMATVITRDFRGYLLTNVINFINNKAKEYSHEVFDTDKIDFKIDGNNISISYDDKEYENLSGGEKQKVDLIVQFAIRDMLCKFLNFSSNIIVLDELFDNLDDIGCQRVLNLVSSKLNDVDSIFIVTHHSDISVPCDNEIIVEKGVDKISRVR